MGKHESGGVGEGRGEKGGRAIRGSGLGWEGGRGREEVRRGPKEGIGRRRKRGVRKGEEEEIRKGVAAQRMHANVI